MLRLAAAFPASDIGHNAIAAEVVASVGNADRTNQMLTAQAWQPFGRKKIILPDIANHFALLHRLPEQFSKLMNRVRSKDQIHLTVTFFDLFRHLRLLYHTPADRDQQLRVAFFQSFQTAQLTEHPILGALSHTAGTVSYTHLTLPTN